METLFTGGVVKQFVDGVETDVQVKSITSMISGTLGKCDIDILMTLKNNIVIGGGNSMPEGFKERLKNDNEGVTIDCEPYRNFNSWVGGSMLASTSVF